MRWRCVGIVVCVQKKNISESCALLWIVFCIASVIRILGACWHLTKTKRFINCLQMMNSDMCNITIIDIIGLECLLSTNSTTSHMRSMCQMICVSLSCLPYRLVHKHVTCRFTAVVVLCSWYHWIAHP